MGRAMTGELRGRSVAGRPHLQRTEAFPQVQVVFGRSRLATRSRTGAGIVASILGLVVVVGVIGHDLKEPSPADAVGARSDFDVRIAPVGALPSSHDSPGSWVAGPPTVLAPLRGSQVNTPTIAVRGSTQRAFHRILVIASLHGVAIGTGVATSAAGGSFELAVPLDPVNPGQSGLPLELDVLDLTGVGRPSSTVELVLVAFPGSE